MEGGRAERSPHQTLAISTAHCLGSEGGSEQACVWCMQPLWPPRACPDSCSPMSPYCPRQRQASHFLGGAGCGCCAEPEGPRRSCLRFVGQKPSVRFRKEPISQTTL